jgi:TctA family transporter
MVCLWTLAHGLVSLIRTSYVGFVVLAPWEMRNILFLSCPQLQPIVDKFPGLFGVPTMIQFFWQDNLVRVTKFICKYMHVMLGADFDDQGMYPKELLS